MKKLAYLFGLLAGTLCAVNTRPHQHPMPNQSHKILDLQPIGYGSVGHINDHYGLDLQSTYDKFPELVSNNGNGDLHAINYEPFIPLIIYLLQQEMRMRMALEQIVEEQTRKIEQFSRMIDCMSE